MANKKEAVFIQIDNERIVELTGAELEAFEADREKLRVHN
jgi:hypothetical protein